MPMPEVRQEPMPEPKPEPRPEPKSEPEPKPGHALKPNILNNLLISAFIIRLFLL